VLHVVIAQVPVVHDALAFARVHPTPHAPQSAVVRSEVSQPLVAALSQLAKVASQLPIAHTPAPQLALALVRRPIAFPQRAPHAPQ
jgi:hypothetical protein